MIVISGALVLVAMVLLVLGLMTQELQFVYGSIGGSLLAFVFLVIGILQRRGEPLTADGPPVHGDAPPLAAPVHREAEAPHTLATPVPAAGSVAVDEHPAWLADEDDDDLEPGGGPVLVVPGRPNYHVEGCRFLTGEPEELDVLDAQEDGFIACTVCRPDEALEELYGPLVVQDEDGNEAPLVSAAPRDEGDDRYVGEVADDATEPVAAGAAEPVTGGAPRGRGGSVIAGGSTSPGPVTAARRPAPAEAASTAPAGLASVVVIPDRARFHAPSCRFVGDVVGATELSRAQAEQSGLRPCGVCKP